MAGYCIQYIFRGFEIWVTPFCRFIPGDALPPAIRWKFASSICIVSSYPPSCFDFAQHERFGGAFSQPHPNATVIHPAQSHPNPDTIPIYPSAVKFRSPP